MAQRSTELEDEAEIQRLMADLNLSREAASLLLTIERGYALVNDRISLSGDQTLDDYLEEIEAASQQPALPPARPGS